MCTIPDNQKERYLTDERNCKGQLPLISSRQFARESVCIHVQRRCMHEAFDVASELFAAIESLQSPIHEQVLAHSELRINRSELRADPKRESC